MTNVSESIVLQNLERSGMI